MLINRILCEYKAENFEKLKKNEKKCAKPLDNRHRKFYNWPHPRTGRLRSLNERERRPARPPGRLKESEMCLVTGPREFLESQ